MKIFKITFLIFWIFFTKDGFANEITSNATSQIDLTDNGDGEGDPDLTVKEGITVIKDNQNNLIKGLIVRPRSSNNAGKIMKILNNKKRRLMPPFQAKI